MKFQDDISNMNTHTDTHTYTHTHTDKPKPIWPPLFQSWGHYYSNILRKTIEGYSNSFDFFTFEKIISTQTIFVSDKTTNMQFSKKGK